MSCSCESICQPKNLLQFAPEPYQTFTKINKSSKENFFKIPHTTEVPKNYLEINMRYEKQAKLYIPQVNYMRRIFLKCCAQTIHIIAHYAQAQSEGNDYVEADCPTVLGHLSTGNSNAHHKFISYSLFIVNQFGHFIVLTNPHMMSILYIVSCLL